MASAPHSRARSSPAALRPAATTRAAPSSFAVCTATRPDRAGRAEDEHVLAALERRAPREGQPAGETGDPERRRERGIRTLGNLDRMRIADRRSFGHPAVGRPTQRTAEDPDDPAVAGPADGLAAGDVRELGMAGRKNAA